MKQLKQKIEKNILHRNSLDDLISMQVQHLLKEVKCNCALTTTELARHLGVSQAYVSQVETGKKGMSTRVLQRLFEFVENAS